MSHYPSTQELAAFRRSIEPDRPPCGPNNQWTGPGSRDDGSHYPWPGGAKDHELRDGIGYRISDDLAMTDDDIEGEYAQARREASALRSRAYWAADCPNGWGLFASYAERVGGIPYWDDPIVSTDTWTEDEPRHPLPIRYQPSFTIG